MANHTCNYFDRQYKFAVDDPLRELVPDMKDCPFCGEHNKYALVVYISDHYALYCAKCDCEGPYSNSVEEAFELWNHRSSL